MKAVFTALTVLGIAGVAGVLAGKTIADRYARASDTKRASAIQARLEARVPHSFVRLGGLVVGD